MADEKPAAKPESKPYTPGTSGEVWSEIAGVILALLLIGMLINAFSGIFGVGGGSSGSVPWYQRFTEKGMLISKTRPLSSLSNPIGMRVASINNTDVYDTPGGKKIGSHKLGDAGRVLQGPVEIDGVKYWYVDYDTDPDGWVKEDDVRSLTQPVSELSNPVGSSVMNTTNADVYDESGNKIGSHKAGDKGKITKGPMYINGEKYWYVDYENGQDGWVKESDIGATFEGESAFDRFIAKFLNFFTYVKLALFLFSIICIIGIIYLWIKIDDIRKEERKLIYPEVVEDKSATNPKWDRVFALADSPNGNDWRLAIIEADIMLSDLIDTMQLPGESMGDKMKLIEKSDFTTIDNAWEAHKARNSIAHEGSDFVLTQRETKRIIGLYQSVFEEFKMI